MAPHSEKAGIIMKDIHSFSTDKSFIFKIEND